MTRYVALLRDGAEISAPSYVRMTITIGVHDGQTTSLNAAVWLPEEDWGTINGVALYTVPTGGQPWRTASTQQAVTVTAGDPYWVRHVYFVEAIPGLAIPDMILPDDYELGDLLPVDFGKLSFPALMGALKLQQWIRRTT